ncbi:MAG: pilus assembly protein [Oscillochloris sp.]|nr:pilus assembly protein [Oscillochloris sp.]
MRVRHTNCGQSVVELTITLPLLFLIIFGMVDFSLAYTTDMQIRNAVAEGGYFAAQHPGDSTGIRTQIRNELRGLNPVITDDDISVNSCVSGSSGPQTEITVTYSYHVLFGLAGSGPTITLRNGTTVPQFGGCN